jgi:erythrin-vacuolar iron transport family protein
MTGLTDGSLSTLAPTFAVAFATHRPHVAFVAGLATAIGAGVSMAFSERLSDSGDLTGRGRPVARGAITGIGTFLGGILVTTGSGDAPPPELTTGSGGATILVGALGRLRVRGKG